MSKPKLDRNVSIPDNLLKKLLTPSETRMLKNRYQIVQALEEGLSIRKIAEQVKVGTDTVVRVSRMLEQGEIRKILDTKKSVKSGLPFRTKTPWIFGKSD